MTAKERQHARIVAHGQQLLAIFPCATERDPERLCKALRRLEAKAAAIALRLCNGPEFPGGHEQVDELCDVILGKVNRLLGNYLYDDTQKIRTTVVPIRINRDPRGYALKIRSEWMEANRPALHKDWGGYGILAPEIDGKP